MRHKHADLIHAWAEGAEIEFLVGAGLSPRWKSIENPSFMDCFEYRIKPTPKPDLVMFHAVSGIDVISESGCNSIKIAKSIYSDWDYIFSLTFDGETGKLKSAEVL